MVTPTASRRLDVQGLRAVAVTVVVAFHAGLPLPGGFLGVDIFFVISGFVITAMLMREWEGTGTVRLGAFYVRRFKRLTPALALMVSVTLVLTMLFLSPFGQQQVTAQTAVGAMALCANWVIAVVTGGYFAPDAEANPLLHTWSLSVEEQFYLLFPVLLLLGWRVGRRLGRPRIGAVVVVTALSLASLARRGLRLARSPARGRRTPAAPRRAIAALGVPMTAPAANGIPRRVARGGTREAHPGRAH